MDADISMLISSIRHLSGILDAKDIFANYEHNLSNKIGGNIKRDINKAINKMVVSTSLKVRKMNTNEKTAVFSKDIIKALTELFLHAARIPSNEYKTLLNSCQAIRTVILSATVSTIDDNGNNKITHIKGEPDTEVSVSDD